MLSRCNFARNRLQRHGNALVKTPPRRLLRAQPGTLRSLSSSSSSSTFSSSSSSPRRGGGIFIGLGWTLLGLVALDQALQYRQEQEAKEHMRVLVVMQQEANEQNQAEWDTSLPTLFQCKIVHTEHSLDGTKMLRNIKVGDVVEVMEEDLGPNKAYHLCRFVPSSSSSNIREKGSIGWYPSEYMEKLETI